MREIKFRGKRVDNGEWVYGYYVFYGHMGVFKHIIITDWAQVYTNSFDVETYTLGQYTGLKDKNGVDIYEGDIIKDKYGQVYGVYFKYGVFWWSIIPLLDVSEPIEVIGNTTENPELLEVE